MAKIKQHAAIGRVHFGPQDPACSSRLSNTVTAYSPRGQVESWVGFVVVFTMCRAPSFRGMSRQDAGRGGLRGHRRLHNMLFLSSADASTLKLQAQTKSSI